jgi:hypothetical protein
MKKPIKLFLFAAVTLTLAFSLLSTRNVKASEGQLCMVGPFIESIAYSGPFCSCHGQPVASSTCQTYYGIHWDCYAILCD